YDPEAAILKRYDFRLSAIRRDRRIGVSSKSLTLAVPNVCDTSAPTHYNLRMQHSSALVCEVSHMMKDWLLLTALW
ncbi:hypothetical protein, partial [Ruegeria meonggei]|uniref:hypothetical protein n=1 Tax=Ruegeria meonggei TaxID=1446476 RepID=UPI001F3A4703